MLERGHDARSHRRLRGAVRAVQKDETVRAPFPHEVRERAVDLFLHMLLADEGAPRQRLAVRGLPRQIEELESRELAPRMLDDRLAVVVERVAQVPAGVARVADGIGVEQAQEFGERQHATPRAEALLDVLGDRQDLRRGVARLAHDLLRLPHLTTTVADTRRCSTRQLFSEHTLNLSVPATVRGRSSGSARFNGLSLTVMAPLLASMRRQSPASLENAFLPAPSVPRNSTLAESSARKR